MRHLFRYYLWLFWNLNIITLILSILSFYKFNTVYCEESEKLEEPKDSRKEDLIIIGIVILLIGLRLWYNIKYGSNGLEDADTMSSDSSKSDSETDAPIIFYPSQATELEEFVPIRFVPKSPPPL
jgi:hypothetical protein